MPVTLGLAPRPRSVLVPTAGRLRPPSRTNGDGSGDGRAPEPSLPAPDAARIAMLVFLAAETMLFAGFIAAFLVFRLGAPVWPPPFQPRLPVGITGVNTAVLLGSGYTMWRAVQGLHRRDRAEVRRRLGQTALLGATFLGLQGSEWLRLLRFGLTTDSGIYGGLFYLVIGAHATHVVAAVVGLLVLGWVMPSGWLGPRGAARLSTFSLYWYFVVGLWPVLYALVYLT